MSRKKGDAVATPEPFEPAGASVEPTLDPSPVASSVAPSAPAGEVYEAITPITTTTSAGERVLLAPGQQFARGFLPREVLEHHLKAGSIVRA